MAKNKKKFVLCIENKDTDDLEKRKIYQIIPDSNAEKEGYIRIVDDSGDDYLYPKNYFIPIQLPLEIQKAISASK